MSDDKNEEKKEIIIDLTEDLNATACKSNMLLQVKAKKQLIYLLNKFCAQSEKHNYDVERNDENKLELEFNPKRYNNTIFISGQRGSGKTTFLRSILLEQAKNNNRRCQYNSEPKCARDNERYGRIMPIAFIDPTLIEINEHIFINLIFKIKDKVESSLTRSSDEKERHKFNEYMEEMAEGLKLLNNTDNNKQQDPSFFLNSALKHAKGGQTLELKFNKLVDKAAEILNVNLFIIAFDDVDTNTKEAFNVLELIRKYLTSPKIAILISGDPALYSYIVQWQRAAELNKCHCKIKNSTEENKELKEMASHLEQQYLAKVLPVENRIELKNLSNLIWDDINIQLILQQKEEIKEIKKHITNIISESLRLNTKDTRYYVDFILEQPIRTVFQILKSINENRNVNADTRNLFYALRDSYIGNLRKEKIPIESLSNIEIHPHILATALFRLCAKHNEFETGFYARPDRSSASYNSSMFVLSSVISHYLNYEQGNFNENAGRFLKLMLSGPAVSTIFIYHVKDKLKINYNHENYITYIGSNKKQHLFNVTAHFSYLISKSNVSLGVIKLSNNYKILNNNDETNNDAFMLASKAMALGSHCVSKSDIKYNYFSIHCLLGSISEILLCEDDDKDLNRVLNLLSQMSNYPAPYLIEDKDEYSSPLGMNASPGVFDEHPGPSTSDTSEETVEHENYTINQYIKSWKNTHSNNKENSALSSLLLGRIWMRIYSSLEFTSNEINKSPKIHLHDAIERLIIAVLNSILVQEARYRFNENDIFKDKLVDLKNIELSPDALRYNLNILNTMKDDHGKKTIRFGRDLPLTYLMITCPLLLPFLISTTNENNETNKKSLFGEIKEIIEAEKENADKEDNGDNGDNGSKGNAYTDFLKYFNEIENNSSEAMKLISEKLPEEKCGKA